MIYGIQGSPFQLFAPYLLLRAPQTQHASTCQRRNQLSNTQKTKADGLEEFVDDVLDGNEQASNHNIQGLDEPDKSENQRVEVDNELGCLFSTLVSIEPPEGMASYLLTETELEQQNLDGEQELEDELGDDGEDVGLLPPEESLDVALGDVGGGLGQQLGDGR